MSAALTTASQYKATVARAKRVLLRSPAGVNGLRSLSRALGIADDCGGAATVTRDALVRALADNGVELSAGELSAIYSTLDRAGAGAIDPAELLAAMRGTLTPLRWAWVHRAWLAVGRKDVTGGVATAELQAMYRAERHPDVLRGTRTAEAVAEEFQATFNATTNPDGVVSQQEFEEYYAGVSGSYGDDEGFTAMLRGVWPMPGVSDEFTASLVSGAETLSKTFSARQTVAEKRIVSAARNSEAELVRVVTLEHRPLVMRSELAMRELSCSLRSATDSSMFLSSDAFMEALRPCRMYMTSAGALAALDTNGDGSVDVLYYLALLLPPMPPARRLMLERLWQRVFTTKDEANRVGIADFHRMFVAGDAVRRDAFLSAWDVRRAIDRKVSLDEFMEWCSPTSAMIQLDKDFEALLCREWKGFAADPK